MSRKSHDVCLVVQIGKESKPALLRARHYWHSESASFQTEYYVSNDPTETMETLVAVPENEAACIIDEIVRNDRLSIRVHGMIDCQRAIKYR